jgi:hypothetical protein
MIKPLLEWLLSFYSDKLMIRILFFESIPLRSFSFMRMINVMACPEAKKYDNYQYCQ